MSCTDTSSGKKRTTVISKRKILLLQQPSHSLNKGSAVNNTTTAHNKNGPNELTNLEVLPTVAEAEAETPVESMNWFPRTRTPSPEKILREQNLHEEKLEFSSTLLSKLSKSMRLIDPAERVNSKQQLQQELAQLQQSHPTIEQLKHFSLTKCLSVRRIVNEAESQGSSELFSTTRRIKDISQHSFHVAQPSSTSTPTNAALSKSSSSWRYIVIPTQTPSQQQQPQQQQQQQQQQPPQSNPNQFFENALLNSQLFKVVRVNSIMSPSTPKNESVITTNLTQNSQPTTLNLQPQTRHLTRTHIITTINTSRGSSCSNRNNINNNNNLLANKSETLSVESDSSNNSCNSPEPQYAGEGKLHLLKQQKYQVPVKIKLVLKKDRKNMISKDEENANCNSNNTSNNSSASINSCNHVSKPNYNNSQIRQNPTSFFSLPLQNSQFEEQTRSHRRFEAGNIKALIRQHASLSSDNNSEESSFKQQSHLPVFSESTLEQNKQHHLSQFLTPSELNLCETKKPRSISKEDSEQQPFVGFSALDPKRMEYYAANKPQSAISNNSSKNLYHRRPTHLQHRLDTNHSNSLGNSTQNGCNNSNSSSSSTSSIKGNYLIPIEKRQPVVQNGSQISSRLQSERDFSSSVTHRSLSRIQTNSSLRVITTDRKLDRSPSLITQTMKEVIRKKEPIAPHVPRQKQHMHQLLQLSSQKEKYVGEQMTLSQGQHQMYSAGKLLNQMGNGAFSDEFQVKSKVDNSKIPIKLTLSNKYHPMMIKSSSPLCQSPTPSSPLIRNQDDRFPISRSEKFIIDTPKKPYYL